MTGLQLEALALRVAERVEARHPIEDSYIELKARWPTDPQKAARRIAAHANEMRGQPVVWIIGIDDDAGSIPGVSKEELSSWYPAVSKFFDQEAPALALSRVVYHRDTPIVALLFDTSTFPYVVTKGERPGTFEREVPMREGTATRSARRSEIIRLFTPQVEPLNIEIRRCIVTADLDAYVPPSGGGFYWWRVWLQAFALVRTERPSYLPTRGFRFKLEVPEGYDEVDFFAIRSLDPGKDSRTVTKTDGDLLIRHAGQFTVTAFGTCGGPPPSGNKGLVLHCEITPAESSRPLQYTIRLKRGLPGTRYLENNDTSGYVLVERDPRLAKIMPPGLEGRPEVRARKWSAP